MGVVTDLVRGPDNNSYVLNYLSDEVYRIEAALGGFAATASIPEPSAAFLLLAACAVAVIYRRRQK
jgi:hypothetical protein